MSPRGESEKDESRLRLLAGGLMQVIPLLVACSAAFGRTPGSEPAALDMARTLVMAAAWISMGVAVAALSWRLRPGTSSGIGWFPACAYGAAIGLAGGALLSLAIPLLLGAPEGLFVRPWWVRLLAGGVASSASGLLTPIVAAKISYY